MYENLEKVSNIIKNRFNYEIMYSKKYLKKRNTEGGFQCLYVRIILIDSNYRKDCNPEILLF